MCDYKKDRKCRFCAITFAICLFTSIALIVGGFFVPPMGVIDGSVLTAVGILFAFGTLAMIKANTVKKISTTLALACFLNLLRKL